MLKDIECVYNDGLNTKGIALKEDKFRSKEDTFWSSLMKIMRKSSGEFEFTDGGLLRVKWIYDEKLCNADLSASRFYSTQIRHLPDRLTLDDKEALRKRIEKHYMLTYTVLGEVETIESVFEWPHLAKERVEKILKGAKTKGHGFCEFSPPLRRRGFLVYGCYEASPGELPLKMVVVQATVATLEDRHINTLG